MTQPPANPKIYHIVNVDRLPSIIADGKLFADSEMLNRPPVGTTIGMHSIKQRRLSLRVTCYSNACVGDFVPFYYCPRSVMLYVIHRANSPELAYKGGQDAIVHLVADLHTVVVWADANKNSWAFTASNAGAAYTSFWRDVTQLSQVNWSHVASNQWSAADVKEAKQAEFLMYKSFPWHLVERIGVRTLATFNAATNAIANAAHKPVVQIMPGWYY